MKILFIVFFSIGLSFIVQPKVEPISQDDFDKTVSYFVQALN